MAADDRGERGAQPAPVGRPARRAGVPRRGRGAPVREAAPSPEAALLAGERRAALLAALSRLREDDRMVIACRCLLDLSEAETAARWGSARAPRAAPLARHSTGYGRSSEITMS